MEVGAWRQEGGAGVSLGEHPGVLRRLREESADILWIGCDVQGVWHFCHRALAARLTSFFLPAGKSTGEKG